MDKHLVRRITPPLLVSLRLFRPEDDEVARAEAALGFELKSAADAWSLGDVSTLRIRPDEWLVRGIEAAMVNRRLRGLFHHVTDLGGGSAVWNVMGQNAADLIAMGGTLDFGAWRPGRAARTLVAKVPMIVSRLEDGFELLADSSHVAYLDAWLRAATAGEVGTGRAAHAATA